MGKNFEIEDGGSLFVKRPIRDILEDAKTINHEKVGTEVLNWVIANVENFIDNQNKIFKLDLVLDDVVGMEETKRLQDLYRAIDDDNEKDLEKATECRRTLDEITAKAFNYIKGCGDQLKKLYNRMIFYYEKVVPSPENKKTAIAIDEELKKLFKQKENASEKEKNEIQKKIVEKVQEGEKLVKFTQYEGSASITNFDYEAFNIGVRIQKAAKEDKENKEIVKEYNVQEGFTVWVEINYKHKIKPTNMF